MSLSIETSLIANIIEETNKVKIFKHKCRKTVLVLEQIQEQLEQNQSLQISPEDQSSINETFNKLLKIIVFLGNDEQIDAFLLSKELIPQPATNIDDCLQNLIDLLNKYKLLNSFELSPEHLITDLENIDKLLTDKYQNQELVQQRRNEISEYIKRTQKPENDSDNISNGEDNLTILNSYPQYKLDPTDYTKGKKYEDNALFACYSGKMKSEPHKKLRIMELHDKSKFKRIFSILTTIKHPYLEKFIGASIDGQNIEIVTLKEGRSLEDLLKVEGCADYGEEEEEECESCDSLEPGDKTILAFKIAQAMAFLHSSGVIHRNLSWSNIFVKKVPSQTEEDEYEVFPIITNFANSHLISRNSILLGMTYMHVNPSMTSFIAPELTDTPNYNEKVDVFAFAGILYELLNGFLPYDKITKAGGSVWVKVKDGQRPNIGSDCPRKLKGLIESCWNQDWHKRPSFYEIVDLMVPKSDEEEMIIFPFDEYNKDSISQFYQQYLVNSNSAKECLETFSMINSGIGSSYQFRFELFSARPIIQNYQILLRTSKYPSLKNLSEDENSKITELKKHLKKLQEVVSNSSPNLWFQTVVLNDVDIITNQLNEYMEKIYNSLNDLNIKTTEKYVEKENDLVFDYRQLNNDFQYILDDINQDINDNFYTQDELNEINGRIESIHVKMNDIDSFLTKRKLNGEKSDETLKSQINDLFEQFKPKFLKNSKDYQIIERINVGITSTVYLGYDEVNNKNVAIKKLSGDHLRIGESSLIPLSREIDILTRLKHEYIAEFIGFCIPEDEVCVWLISEFIGGGSIFSEKERLSGFDKTKIAFEIAEAMEYIRAQRILHRDLKTENILISKDKSPKIIDFGYARSEIINVEKSIQRGTYNYMAPEVVESGNYSFEADVYSFGMILWEMMSNKVPFYNLSLNDIPLAVSRGVKLKFTSNCPKPLKDLIISCTSRVPSKRPSFSEIIELMMEQDDYIMFVGANLADVKAFYEQKALKRQNKAAKS